MNATLLSLDLRGRRLSTLALASAVLLAACDNDQALGPNAANQPTPTTAILTTKTPRTGALRITIVDQNNALPTTAGALFSVARSGSPASLVSDNAAGDSYSGIGVILMVNLPTGMYTVCPSAAPAEYVLPTPSTCQNIQVVAGTSTIADASHVMFTVLTAPRASWVTTDGINGDSIAGVTVTGNDGSGPVAITDNSALDLDPRNGVFEIKVLSGTTYTVCQKAAPAGYTFPPIGQNCLTKAVTPGQTTALGSLQVRHEYSAYWFVNVDGWPSKGAEFALTHAGTGVTIKVADDGQNDMSDGMIVYVKLPAAGWWTICETSPPDGGQLAEPQCKRIEVFFGEYGWAGEFRSKPI